MRMITIPIQYSIIIIIIIIIIMKMEIIKGLNKQKPSSTWGCTQNQPAKERLKMEYTWRLRRMLKSWLNAENKITTGSLAVWWSSGIITRVGTLIVATIYLQLIQNRYTFRSFTVLQCSHQHCVQPVTSYVEVVGYI